MHYFLRKCRMNEKIHHFSVRLYELGRTTPALLPCFTFVAFYSRRFWLCSSTSFNSNGMCVTYVITCVMTYAFDKHKNARMWTSIVYSLVLRRTPSMNVKTTPIRHAATHVSLALLLVLWHMPLTNIKKQVGKHSIKLGTHCIPWSHCAVCIQFALGAQ